MFRITRYPSSGSSIQYLAKITVMVLLCPLIWTQSVLWQHICPWCVYVLHSVERHCVCTAQCREALCVYWIVQRGTVCVMHSAERHCVCTAQTRGAPHIYLCTCWIIKCFNLLTPNVNYSGRTAPLTSKVAFYIFIQQIQVLTILNMVYILLFSLFKMQFVS